MCGFAGVVAWDDRYRVSRETLGRMSASIAHRGPDGEGYHINHEGEVTPERPQIALAFRRLAILDPDPRSNQPFTDGRHWLVFNGEIYNFRELRAELKSLDPSYEWRTSGDTEVLLRAYAVWGEKCLPRLNGMFALAIWDEQNQELFLARDRMGQKPLYVASGCRSILDAITTADAAAIDAVEDRNPFVAFASELAALRVAPGLVECWDDESVESYLRWGYGLGFRNVGEIAPGTFAKYWSNGKHWPGGGRYFDPNLTDGKTLSDGEAVSETRRRVSGAVKRQLVSDVPLGCFLSGGIDSSVIAACMTAAVGMAEVLTFSVGFDDRRYDESAYARAVAKHLGTCHHEFSVRPDAANDLPKLAAALGEPFADSSILPTYYLARETRRHVTVALSGDGGDEFFGGYDRYRAMQMGERLVRVPAIVRSMAVSRLWNVAGGTHPKSRRARVKRLLATIHHAPAERYAGYVGLFDDRLLGELLGRPPQADQAYLEAFESLRKGRDVVQAALATDRVTYLPNDLLKKVDRASMLHALEVRSPFMDPDVVTFAAGLTTDQLLKGGPKRMLREAFAADLPDFVFKRKKMGFAVPIGEWFRGELRPMLRDHLFATNSFARQHFNIPVVERLVDEHEQLRVDHSQRLYALFMLELWWRLQS